MNRRILVIIGILAILIVGAGIYAYSSPTQPDTKRLIVSTTTSLEDTGLLKEIETAFEDKYPGVDVSPYSMVREETLTFFLLMIKIEKRNLLKVDLAQIVQR